MTTEMTGDELLALHASGEKKRVEGELADRIAEAERSRRDLTVEIRELEKEREKCDADIAAALNLLEQVNPDAHAEYFADGDEWWECD